MQKSVILLFTVITAVLVTGCQTTSPSGHVVVQDGNTRVGVSFNEYDRRAIYDYYRPRGKRVPPGLAKKGKLPPGLAKRQVLPPGLQGRHLPHDLLRQLSPLPRDFIHLRVGTDIVIMNQNTRVIFDVISGID